MDDTLNGKRLHQHWKKILITDYKRCEMMMRNEISVSRLNDDVKTVIRFCYLANEINTSVEMIVMERKNQMEI